MLPVPGILCRTCRHRTLSAPVSKAQYQHISLHVVARSLAGRLTYTDGCAYEGMWRSDRRHGVGTYYGINGDVFVGTFVDDKRHGLGTTYMPSRGGWTITAVATGVVMFEPAGHFSVQTEQ